MVMEASVPKHNQGGDPPTSKEDEEDPKAVAPRAMKRWRLFPERRLSLSQPQGTTAGSCKGLAKTTWATSGKYVRKLSGNALGPQCPLGSGQTPRGVG